MIILNDNNYNGDITSKRDENKIIKEFKLLESAYELFTTKGINNTVISDITKKAGVAKGTFYLYFKDKYDIIDKIVLKKSFIILREAMLATKQKELNDFTEEIIYAVDFIINKLNKDKKLLKLLYKDLSLGIYRKALKEPEKYEEMKEVVQVFNENLLKRGVSEDEAEKLLFLILEMISGVIYTAIIVNEPYSLEEIKPTLYNAIRKIVQI